MIFPDKDKKLLFNFSQELYNNYSTLKIPSELINNFINLSNKYNINYEIYSSLDIRELYNLIINKFYHNETTIKSNFINNVLLKYKYAVNIFELNVSSSRVDLCKIDRKSTAFEIKTDLDNFSRLQKQIEDYSKVFEEIYIICSLKNVNNILSIIPNYCGIYSYTINSKGKYIFKKEKYSEKHNLIDSFSQLNLMSENVLANNFKQINIYKNKHSLINQILNTYSTKYINSVFKKIIKEKYKKKWLFLKSNHKNIYELDYQWFYKNNINPNFIYNKKQ